MNHRGNWRLRGGLGAFAGALVLGMSGYAAAPAYAGQPGQAGPVSAAPATGTPELTTPGGGENVSELKQCGGTMYAAGSFTSITQAGTAYRRDNLFSFSASAPYTMTSWAPDVNGTVNTIAFDGSDCANIYIGGSFSSVNGTAAQNIAEISTTTGDVDTAFAHSANADVDTMAVSGSHLLTGGGFTSINGTSGSSGAYYASLNTTTGKDDGYLSLNISGHYQYGGASENTTRVSNQQVSPSGGRVMVEGDFTSVGGQARQQIFQMWLGPHSGVVTGWRAPIFNTHCATTEPFYARAAAWSPGDTTVYVATTGDHIYDWDHKFPLTGPCDAALAFSASEGSETPSWINYSGCDSYYSVAADDSAVYVGGHVRWADNPDGCNHAGPGAITDYGMQGLSPDTGKVELSPSGGPLYSMSRANADDMVISAAGLWIASSNRMNDDSCNAVSGVAGICFLPYAG